MKNNEIILLVGHGSRYRPGNEEILKFTDQWRVRNPDWRIDICFIELAEPLLDQGLEKAAATADRVIVVPLILNAAGHVKMEIPAHLEQARSRHPRTEFIYAHHLGATNHTLQILKRNLHKTMMALDMPDPKSTGVILLGRGSSDRIANGEVAKLARWLYEESEHDLLDIAFTGIAHPRLELVVMRQVRLGMTQIVLLPYYLFTGTLIERIHRQVKHLERQYPAYRFASAGHFGFEEEIFIQLDERVRATRGEEAAPEMMACDGCKYRLLAEQQEHGHLHTHNQTNGAIP